MAAMVGKKDITISAGKILIQGQNQSFLIRNDSIFIPNLAFHHSDMLKDSSPAYEAIPGYAKETASRIVW